MYRVPERIWGSHACWAWKARNTSSESVVKSSTTNSSYPRIMNTVGFITHPHACSLSQNLNVVPFLRIWWHDSPCGWSDIAIVHDGWFWGKYHRHGTLTSWNGWWYGRNYCITRSRTMFSMGDWSTTFRRRSSCRSWSDFHVTMGYFHRNFMYH